MVAEFVSHPEPSGTHPLQFPKLYPTNYFLIGKGGGREAGRKEAWYKGLD
jgi:hypothetical protein